MQYNKTNLHVYIVLEFVTVFGAVMYAGNVCIFTFLKKFVYYQIFHACPCVKTRHFYHKTFTKPECIVGIT
jgi:hypothetical protein